MKNRWTKGGMALLSILLLGGCQSVGPDFQGVGKAPVPQKWVHNDKSNLSRSDKAISKWWETFNDPTLNLLVKKAYAQNLDIQAAGLRIVQARSVLGISEGLAFPQMQQLNAQASSSHTKQIDIATASVGFDMGWEMDLWGKYARGIESSQAQLYASVASYNNVMVSVISEVARNYINYRTAEERLAYAKRNVVIQERVTRMTEIQFNSGNVSELDMQQARSQLYNTRSLIPAMELTKVKSRNAIALLLASNEQAVDVMLEKQSRRYHDRLSAYIGKEKKGTIQLKEKQNSVLNVKIIPYARFNPYNKIDAGLITRRPDIKVAEYQVRSKNALIGAAKAELYPSFSLFGNIGLNSNNSTGSWVSPSNALGVTVGPSFSWNIFQYGRIKNQIRLKDAQFEESLVNYNKQVLFAVTEVSNALSSYIYIKKQQNENRKAVEATVRAFNISVIQYNDGLVSYQRLLTTVEKLTSTQDRYATIKGNLALNAISLYKALGGGWQINRGNSYLSEERAAKMKKRIDWDKYLDPSMTKLPKGLAK